MTVTTKPATFGQSLVADLMQKIRPIEEETFDEWLARVEAMRTSDELLAELHRLRALPDYRPRHLGKALDVSERYAKLAAAEGKDLTGLGRGIKDEYERFRSYVIPGPDGHEYWNGPQDFTRNDGKSRRPIRWAWEHAHGPIPVTTDVWATCGEKNCIALAHLTSGRSPARWRGMREEQILGAMQTFVLRLGRAPTGREWDEANLGMSSDGLRIRYGNWEKALARYGLEPVSRQTRATEESCLRALHRATKKLGRFPSQNDYGKLRPWLKEQALLSSETTIRTHLGGTWTEARRRYEEWQAGRPGQGKKKKT